MDLTPYVDLLRRELAVAAEAGGDEARALADRLTAPLESAIRLTLLEALSAATAEITRDLAPGSVDLRLRGREPDFVVTPARTAPAVPDEQPPTAPPATWDDAATAADKGATSRINLRLPDEIKARVEEAATRERLSVNAWLVRAATAALGAGTRPTSGYGGASHGQRFTGWVR
ncbi:toxin-antitoxin system HicB family antitoxin [Polymorphospora rubra]|uniref:toxin-antitoxin system HicB family antitoxin n=1 Tax=Polymorphospora rubra TaxID=338584 RepID=UPI0033F96753